MKLTKRDNLKTKILIVGPLAPPPGGVATSVSNLLKSELKNVFHLIHLRSSNARSNDKKGKIDLLNIFFFLKQFIWLITLIIRQHPEIVQIESSLGISLVKNSFFIIFAKLIARRKIVLCLYGNTDSIELENSFCQQSRLRKRLIKSVLDISDIIKVESQKRKKFFVDKIGIAEAKIFIIPNAVYLNRTPKIYNQGVLELLFIGWLDRNKGIFDLLESTKRLKQKKYQFKLKIVGPEGRAGEWDKAIAAVKNNDIEEIVRIYGEKLETEISILYKMAHIFLLPSYFEGLPYSILEAMANGLPIISTNVGAIPEVIEDGVNGFLINPGDVNALTAKIEILMKDRALIRKIGENNQRKIENEYSMENQVKKYINLYQTFL